MRQASNLLRWVHRPLTLPLYASFALPKHEVLTMPSLSPTMSQGKIVKWLKKVGDKIQVGDAIAEIETDKATLTFDVQDKGYLASIVEDSNAIQVGVPIAVVTKKEAEVGQFKTYKFGAAAQTSASPAPAATSAPTPAATPAPAKVETPVASSVSSNSSGRVVASPLAKSIAGEKGIDLSAVSGSGPGGRILKQDVESFKPAPVATVAATAPAATTKAPAPIFSTSENPFQDLPLTGMRKTIAKRLQQSKQTVPHYYLSDSVEMDALIALRAELNKNQKENGVKITINDIIIKAVALALRDYPDVNVNWQETFIRRFRHSDISVAVAIDGGLITPIVYKAETLGLLQIAKRTKDLAKRAKEGKLNPSEYVGGTSTVSNIGMFGIETVASIINPPQASILGIGKTEKKLLYADAQPPYRVAQVCQLIASIDHRAVDGALGAQWLRRIKFYLQRPTNMLL